MKRRNYIIIIIIAVLLLPSLLSFSQEIYQWVDDKGTLHFTDDLSLVSERYRGQIQKKEFPNEPISSPSIPVQKEADLGKRTPSAPDQKDLLGRGEEWWRAKAKEWNDKLVTAQKNFEAAQTNWKNKEKELEESKFKPDSFKRKLKAEMKVLEEKVNAWAKQSEEAKNMLEKVLPRQAEEYHANPNWLNIDK